eukprot:SAG11_NODE_1163_length_5624_cov_7.819186_4_plen_320_part_00
MRCSLCGMYGTIPGILCLRRIGNLGEFSASAIRRLEQNMRCVRSRAETVGQLLINHRKLDNAFDPAREHDCCCHKFPKEWRRKRQFHGHFCILSEEYDGPAAAAVRCSHKTPVETSAYSAYSELYKSLCKLRSTLPLTLRRLMTDQMVTEIVVATIKDTGGKAGLMRAYPPPPRGMVTKQDVLKVKRYLRGACISPVDKGAGRLAIMCHVVQHMVMEKAWPCEPHRCTVVCKATESAETSADIENEILKREIDTYHRMGWRQAIADLYGVRNGAPHGCCLSSSNLGGSGAPTKNHPKNHPKNSKNISKSEGRLGRVWGV